MPAKLAAADAISRFENRASIFLANQNIRMWLNQIARRVAASRKHVAVFRLLGIQLNASASRESNTLEWKSGP
ncbi:MAG: hypothetical protein QM739_00620 [Propionivibrio sp.]